MSINYVGKIIAACSLLLALVACEDETIGRKHTTQQCASPQDCKDSESCINNICVTNTCTSKDDCPEGQICDAGKCSPQTNEPECTHTKDCALPLVCYKEQCVDGLALGESCLEGELPCVGGNCVKGTCVAYVEEGQACDNETSLCNRETHFCKEGHCAPLGTRGEWCDASLEKSCVDGLACLITTCVQFSKENEPCNSTDLLCELASGLSCHNGLCKHTAQENEECNEQTKPCVGENLVCVDNKCMQKLGDCTKDEECKADSYCCTMSACTQKNICLPYGSGPGGNNNEACSFKTVPGLFEADVQCEWNPVADSDPYPKHDNILDTPMVMNLKQYDNTASEIIVISYNNSDGGAPSGQGSDRRYYGVIRILNGETCQPIESIYDSNNQIIGGSNLATADLDGDGFVEIVAYRGQTYKDEDLEPHPGMVAFRWDATQKKYTTWWTTDQSNSGSSHWDGPAIHDVNNDGKPEVIGRGGEVFDGTTGKKINVGQPNLGGIFPTVGDLDADGTADFIGSGFVFSWDSASKTWIQKYTVSNTSAHFAFADFGTAHESPETFDFDTKDGIAEVASSGGGIVRIATLSGQVILEVTGLRGGGPTTIGDFDKDGHPEIAVAFGDSYRVFDPQCLTAADGCAKKYILWEKVSQDASSSSTGSSLFDFDGDGQAEVVYADECYTRIYEGKTGEVLFSSYRSSGTWHENPVIADVDNDESAEIIVGSNNAMGCQLIDPIHRGLRCEKNKDCKSNLCDAGFCRCTTDDQCNSRKDANGTLLNEYSCVDALAPQTGKLCRAIHPAGVRVTGIRVLRDRLDRWASSRSLWNQHAYSITNINDDGTVPQTSNWLQNFKDGLLNNFRQNSQGSVGANKAPDITGKFDRTNVCKSTDGVVKLGGVVCNRGAKMVASKMPATFYAVAQDETRTKLCTSYTESNVPVGACLRVECIINDLIDGNIVMVVNDDGDGRKTTVECNENNNEDSIKVANCQVN